MIQELTIQWLLKKVLRLEKAIYLHILLTKLNLFRKDEKNRV